ncbi:MAG: Gfo/Idh/MocA family oxidoreductase [Bacteroidales bacterium]|nr:Gfo/Idh/MocA family oxidoreductase [Bacteroidales bacterium]
MIKELTGRFKRIRSEQFLSRTYCAGYAFVGMGQHSLTNLYPVLSYLGIPLRYVCVTSEAKARQIEKKYPGVRGTTSLDEILSDPDVKGVFVAASPSAHFSIASKVLGSGKALFIEKPPCMSSSELESLISMGGFAEVGLQKRYAPAVQILKSKLSSRLDKALSYDIHYVTGAYPEGDALGELYIHPLDLVNWLFGKAEILSLRKTADNDYVLMLDHGGVVGTMELSTGFSWDDAREDLTVRTRTGIYQLHNTGSLSFTARPAVVLGVPLEKIGLAEPRESVLAERNSFSPVLAGNIVYTQGFYDEILAFAEAVEGRKSCNLSSLESLRDTFSLIESLRKAK